MMDDLPVDEMAVFDLPVKDEKLAVRLLAVLEMPLTADELADDLTPDLPLAPLKVLASLGVSLRRA